MTTTNLDAIEGELKSRLDRLLRRVRAVTDDLRAAHDDDWVEQATELENDSVLERLDDMTRREVEQIRLALSRIKGGTYGVCVVCHLPIDAVRLRAVPTADSCVGCGPDASS